MKLERKHENYQLKQVVTDNKIQDIKNFNLLQSLRLSKLTKFFISGSETQPYIRQPGHVLLGHPIWCGYGYSQFRSIWYSPDSGVHTGRSGLMKIF